ncbi:MAG: hypothetical protein WCI74_05660 [Actinomycetes bacterium]
MSTDRAVVRYYLTMSADDSLAAIYVPCSDHPALFARIRTWLRPGGILLFTHATRDYTGYDRFNGTKQFLGRDLFYSHTTPQDLFEQLAQADLAVLDAQNRVIGGETFMWATATPAYPKR